MSRPKWGGSGPLDQRVLDLMSEFPGAITFAGLRRTLGVHQESLSRTLHRLEKEGHVERSDMGYRIPERSFLPAEGASTLRFPARGERPQAELRLTHVTDSNRILGSMAGRWFGRFRWVGSFEKGDRTTLLWTSESTPERLALVMEGNRLQIYHRGPTDSANPETSAAYELLQQSIGSLNRSAASPDSTVFLRSQTDPQPPVHGVAF